MRTLEAIIFDFDRVVADCQRSGLLPGAATFIREAVTHAPLAIASGAMTRDIVSGLDALTLDVLATLVNRKT